MSCIRTVQYRVLGQVVAREAVPMLDPGLAIAKEQRQAGQIPLGSDVRAEPALNAVEVLDPQFGVAALLIPAHVHPGLSRVAPDIEALGLEGRLLRGHRLRLPRQTFHVEWV